MMKQGINSELLSFDPQEMHLNMYMTLMKKNYDNDDHLITRSSGRTATPIKDMHEFPHRHLGIRLIFIISRHKVENIKDKKLKYQADKKFKKIKQATQINYSAANKFKYSSSKLSVKIFVIKTFSTSCCRGRNIYQTKSKYSAEKI